MYKANPQRVTAAAGYRPLQANTPGVQLKLPGNLRSETRTSPAPPVYRPQDGHGASGGGQKVAPHVVQLKAPGSLRLETRAAPPVYRPSANRDQGAQPKSAASF